MRTLVLWDQEPTPMTSFNHNCLLIGHISNTVPLGIRASTYEFGGDTVKGRVTSLLRPHLPFHVLAKMFMLLGFHEG